MKESECEMCQCLENVYVCDMSSCAKPPMVIETEMKTVEPSTPPIFIVPSTVAPPPKCENHL